MLSAEGRDRQGAKGPQRRGEQGFLAQHPWWVSRGEVEGRDLWALGAAGAGAGRQSWTREDRIPWGAPRAVAGSRSSCTRKGGSEPTGSLASKLDLGSRRQGSRFGRGAGMG